MPWVSTTPLPDFYLAGGVPEDQNLMSVQPQKAAQSAQYSQPIPQPEATPKSDAGSYEIIFWESIKDSANADAFKAYLEQYPDGAFAPLARIKLQRAAPEKESAYSQPTSKETVPTQLASIDSEEKDPDIIARDGHYIKYRNGTVYDTKTGLEWLACPGTFRCDDGNGAHSRWISQLKLNGGGWRLPSISELKNLYRKGAGKKNMTHLLEAKAWYICSKESNMVHWYGLNFKSSRSFFFQHNSVSSSIGFRHLDYTVLAVRSRK